MTPQYMALSSASVAFLGCLVLPFLPNQKKSIGGFLFVLVNAAITSPPAWKALMGQIVEFTFYGGIIFGDITLRIDSLSAWFILIVNLTCVNGALYGIDYIKPNKEQPASLSLHWTAFLVFHTSMLGVCAFQHGLVFLVAWEIMTVSSLILVMFDHSRIKVLTAGINYLVQMHIGVACLTIAFIWMSTTEGSYDFSVIPSFFSKPEALWVYLLFFIGFGVKAGFIPLHSWLPHAHPAAPSHISGVMSGVIVKMGVYGIIRMIAYLNTGLVVTGEIILIVSVATAFYGILSAAVHRDYKRMLAFCTIENIGIIGMGLGMGMIGKGIGEHEIMFLGFSAALLHVLNHSLYKSLLFFAAGNVYQLSHTKNMELLGGLIKSIPWTAFFFLCGSLAISGLPPFNGFVSKFLLFFSLVEGIKIESFQLNVITIVSMMGLAIVGGMSILTFTKSFGVIFLGSPRSKQKRHETEVISPSHLPFFIILFLMLAVGISPSVIIFPIQRIVQVLDSTSPLSGPTTAINPLVSSIGTASMLLILLIGTVYVLRSKITGKVIARFSSTWGCGYAALNLRMQYTGKSFTKTLAKLFGSIVSEQKNYSDIEEHEVFPMSRSYQSNYAEFFEKNIINKVSNQILHFMNHFTFIHNGQVQMYVLYGLIFMMILIITTIYNIL